MKRVKKWDKMKLTPVIIKEIVQDQFKINNFIVDHRRERERIPRHVFIFLLCRYTTLSWYQIRDMVKFKNHSGVGYSHKYTLNTLMNDHKYGDLVRSCDKRCQNIIRAYLKELENES